jgi:phosphatidylinositol glycan class A protein
MKDDCFRYPVKRERRGVKPTARPPAGGNNNSMVQFEVPCTLSRAGSFDCADVEKKPARPSTHCIAMVCDFFYPSTGGVEVHIQALARCLQQLGHRVIVITHKYGTLEGVRWISGVKVFYVSRRAVWGNCILPTGVLLLPCLRRILIQEHVDIVHTHAVCTMAFEAAVLAALMGHRVVHTEHSNYGFTGLDSYLNTIQQFVLSHADAVISVSHSSRENVSRRCRLDSSGVCVIPNAVDASRFCPKAGGVDSQSRINVIVMARLVKRKGVHLLAELLPKACATIPDVHFIIGGDGPQRYLLHKVVETYGLDARVELLGEVPHCDVPAVLTRGHIFLNTSITEAFCISIIEAAACGLAVISTRVGGVPELLPSRMLRLVDPDPTALLAALSDGVSSVRSGVPRDEFHRDVSRMYSWPDVARRTAHVYDGLSRRLAPTLVQRCYSLRRLGPLVWPAAICLLACQRACLSLLRCWRPAGAGLTAAGLASDVGTSPRAGDG